VSDEGEVERNEIWRERCSSKTEDSRKRRCPLSPFKSAGSPGKHESAVGIHDEVIRIWGVFGSIVSCEQALSIQSAQCETAVLGRKRVVFDRSKANQMHVAGSSVREIATALQVGRGTVHRFLLSQKGVGRAAS
jgi:hypothetical protein